MKPSTELFKLIKSLSKSEKRFFKLTSSLQTGEKNYLKIFDFIDKQFDYDEEAVKKEFKGEVFVKHFPSEKNHLYKLILKSLRSFYSEQSVSSLLKQEIKNIEILYNKALYKECEKFVSRAKKLAEPYEKFYYWYELISWQKKLLEEAYEEGEFSGNLDELIEEEEMVVAKLRNLAEYQVIYSKINLIFRSGGFTRNNEEQKVVESIADYHLIKGKNTAISTKATSICYYIKGLCAATNRDYESSFQFFNRTKEVLNNNPMVKEDSPQRYVMTLFHLLRCYIDSKDFDKATSLVTEIRQLVTQKGFNSMDIAVRIFTNTYNQELHMLHVMGEMQKSVDLLSVIEKEKKVYEGKISKEQEVTFLYNQAYSYFGIGNYKKSLSFINEVLNDNEQNLRQDIYGFSRLLNLLLHYELENYDFLEYAIKSTNRYLSKTKRNYQIESVFIKYIRKVSKVVDASAKMKVFKEMKIEVEALLNIHEERVILEFFDVSAWICSKIHKKPFDEAVKMLLKEERTEKLKNIQD